MKGGFLTIREVRVCNRLPVEVARGKYVPGLKTDLDRFMKSMV